VEKIVPRDQAGRIASGVIFRTSVIGIDVGLTSIIRFAVRPFFFSASLGRNVRQSQIAVTFAKGLGSQWSQGRKYLTAAVP